VNIPKEPEHPDGEVTSIGMMGLMHPGLGLHHHQRAEFMIMLDPVYQGKGYGEEALRWLLCTGFRHANLHRIEGSYYYDNLPAAKLYRKVSVLVAASHIEPTCIADWTLVFDSMLRRIAAS
jgi:RimJ/RimL family protein N-acetyltransferase